MAYIGKGLVGVLSENKAVDTMSNPNGVLTTMTLSRTPGSVNNVEVYIDGVFQTPGDEFTLAGDVLTFTTAPATNAVVIAVVGNDSTIANVDNNTITGTMFPDGSVTDSKISGINSTKISGTLPALDGSSLTNLTTGNLQGTLPALDGSPLTGVQGFRKNASDPLSNSNGNQGDVWVNTASGEVYVLTNHTVGSNIWTNIGGGTGNIIVNVLPGMPTDNFASGISTGTTHNHTFIGGTDTGSSNSDISGAVTHYVVDQISNANALSVAASEVAAGSAHVFTAATITNNVTFRVRSKDNNGGFSADRIISVNVDAFTGMVATSTNSTNSSGIIDGDYKYHIFNTSGSFNVTTAGENAEVELLLIAGGGSAGGSDVTTGYSNERGGGGGAGGYRHITNITNLANSTNYTITVGGGGSRVGLYLHTSGTNSSALTYSATGGGSGGISRHGSYDAYWGGYEGNAGGSGGGAMGTFPGAPGGAGNLGGYTPVEGYAGGSIPTGTVNTGKSSGGGGSAGPGIYVITGGGGPGTASTITGSSVTRAAGGQVANNTTSGAINSGDGGDSGINTTGSGAGGSGVVIIRYKFQ